uniref:Secreted protein n=1 Tax=Setaria viridis TaxID=4556 RepID=A0A4U6U1G9_SETVI|nr:hypothetical protein SEVIR_6G036750v2 [Setaria viridis]TKW08633.1 hypothetical protein SEVIR_6G036750v2 [Setaria viridis]TKW08634.1 hypothetical protein SEVIR_6G036750v2 [Setaria viridis]TKW08635.1 hypothetical protein SEVIR_6G036750v2 [Setaria viridis]
MTSCNILLALVARVVLPWTRGLGIVHWRTISMANLVLLHSMPPQVCRNKLMPHTSPVSDALHLRVVTLSCNRDDFICIIWISGFSLSVPGDSASV